MEREIRRPKAQWRSMLGISRTRLHTAFKVGMSAFLIAWVLRDTDLREISDALRVAELRFLGLVLLLHVFGWYISSWRWANLLRAQGTDVSIPFLIQSFVIGIFFNNLLPSTVGGDVYRAYDSSRLGQSKAKALIIVFVDRFMGLTVLIAFAFIGLVTTVELRERLPTLHLWISLAVIGSGLLTLVIFFLPRNIISFLEEKQLPLPQAAKTLLAAFFMFRGRYRVLLGTLVLSLLLQINVVLSYYFIGRGLGLSVPLEGFFLIIPIAVIAMMLPISVNAIGVRENVFAFFLSMFLVTRAEAIAFAWIAYGVVVLQGLIGGSIYVLRR